MSDLIELDECLEALYHLWERHELEVLGLEHCRSSFGPSIVERMASLGLIEVSNHHLGFTEKGLQEAALIIRRHRLAERLLADVLHMGPDEVEKGACEFEHIIAEEITESLCTLLGHPRACPHGLPIPEGRCCRNHARDCVSAVVTLWEMPVGVSSRIAYVCSTESQRQQQLARMGVLPGARIKVHQTRPFVAVLDNARIAMEPSVAKDILVWARPLPETATNRSAVVER